MKGLRSITPLGRDSLRGIEAATIVGEEPTVEWVSPRDLFVEEDYQRDVGEAGTALIRRIVGEFSWHKFKAPICFKAAEFDGALVVVDGQHTSIGCATRGIERIPVMVYANASAAQRAAAFVAHNRDRVALTMLAIFKADMAAGDLIALQADRACRAAGAKILTQAINLSLERPVGETMAVGSLRAIVRKVGPEHLERVMRVLVAAKRGPIKAQEINAASSVLLHWKGASDIDERLARLIASKSAKVWASLGAHESGTLPQALMTLWLRELNARIEQPPSRRAPERIVVSPPRVERPIAHAEPTPPPQRSVPVSNYRAPDPPAPKKVSVVFLAQANGVSVSAEGMVSRVGAPTAVNVGRTGARLVARLVSVMPAQIGFDRLADKVFDGQASRRQKLDDLVASVNPDLRKVRLEIFHVKASGYMIREMANSGDNRLLA